jgi:hypothetical protein
VGAPGGYQSVRVGARKEQNASVGNNKFIAVKETIVRQMS